MPKYFANTICLMTDSHLLLISYSLAHFSLYRYKDLSSGGDSSNCDSEVEIPEDLDEKEMETPAVKDESQSEDIKPADSSARLLSSEEESLIQATLSSMVKKAEAKKAIYYWIQCEHSKALASMTEDDRRSMKQGVKRMSCAGALE
ncbi:unnamed protein product [Urochloa humidicola]